MLEETGFVDIQITRLSDIGVLQLQQQEVIVKITKKICDILVELTSDGIFFEERWVFNDSFTLHTKIDYPI
jgi:hypothetical protein